MVPGPPSQAGVQPEEVGGSGDCPADTTSFLTEAPIGESAPSIPGDGQVLITRTTDDLIGFSFLGDEFVARQVNVISQANTTNVYFYGPPNHPNGIAADALLHTPVDEESGALQPFDILQLCLIPNVYDSNGGNGVV
jgi:hypothetical protein